MIFQDAVNTEMTKDEQRTKDMRVNINRALAEFPAAFAKVCNQFISFF